MDSTTFMAFLTYTAIMAFTPGPNNILTLSTVGHYGLRASRSLIMGVSGGFFAVMFLSGLFSLSLARLLPAILPWLLWCGAAYILWLAWHIAFARGGNGSSATHKPKFLTGFLLQFVNAKVWLCGLTGLSAFVLPHTTEPYTVLAYSLAIACVGASGNLVWGLAGNVLRGAFQRWGRQLNLALGISLAYCSVRMLV